MKADAKYHLTQLVHKESLSERIVYLSLLFNDKKMSVFCLVYNFLFETRGPVFSRVKRGIRKI